MPPPRLRDNSGIRAWTVAQLPICNGRSNALYGHYDCIPTSRYKATCRSRKARSCRTLSSTFEASVSQCGRSALLVISIDFVRDSQVRPVTQPNDTHFLDRRHLLVVVLRPAEPHHAALIGACEKLAPTIKTIRQWRANPLPQLARSSDRTTSATPVTR